MAVVTTPVARAAADPHACCHPHAAPHGSHHQASVCQHCTHAALAAPKAHELSAPSTLPAFAMGADIVLPVATHAVLPLPASGFGHAPPPTPSRLCVRTL
jgi:hypothetical protein